MKKKEKQIRKLGLNKMAIAKLNQSKMTTLLGGENSTRPNCDTVKPPPTKVNCTSITCP
jgi:natural product precursor